LIAAKAILLALFLIFSSGSRMDAIDFDLSPLKREALNLAPQG